MSILIKGIEMPKSCNACFFNRTTKVLFDDDVCALTGKLSEFNNKRADCPLIELPPHGRLIDADEMFTEFVTEGQRSKRYKIGEKWELNGEEIRGVISRLPTVIPAEEGE